MERTRRGVLAGAAALAAGGLAGCASGLDVGAEGDENDGAFSTFYTLETFTRQVVGDRMEVTNPIPAGEMGHRYEVGNSAQLDAARSAAFVYVDVEGFQNWARDAARNLESDRHEVTVVDALEGVELLDFDGHGGDDEDGHGDGNDDDEDGHDDGAHDDEAGHDDDDEDGEGADHGHGDESGPGGGHGDFDPHYWLDPTRAAASVETIADGLAEADPDNATGYRENADEYVEELQALDEEFAEALSGREVDTVVVAGHDSYQYLAARYDFEVHSPVGVSPNAEPSSAEIAETVEVVDDLDLDVVLYDEFESPTLAETIVEESGADEPVAVSSVEGTKPDWEDDGWGYIDQMKEINLPAFEAALKAA